MGLASFSRSSAASRKKTFNSGGYCHQCAPHAASIEASRKRAALGSRVAGRQHQLVGDLFIAFSTAVPALIDGRQQWSTLKNDDLDPLLTATVQATEEAIINALIAAKTMRGINGNTFYALPHERLREVLKKYNRLLEKEP
jgi:L-aminopeptidase/D-esterase-like protein